MKQIFIQDSQTKRFLRWDNQWTADEDRARTFATSLNAISYCYQHGVPHAQLVVRSNEHDEMNVVVPVSG